MGKKIELSEEVYHDFSIELWKAVKWQGRSGKPIGTKDVLNVYTEYAKKYDTSTTYWANQAYKLGYQPYTR